MYDHRACIVRPQGLCCTFAQTEWFSGEPEGFPVNQEVFRWLPAALESGQSPQGGLCCIISHGGGAAQFPLFTSALVYAKVRVKSPSSTRKWSIHSPSIINHHSIQSPSIIHPSSMHSPPIFHTQSIHNPYTIYTLQTPPELSLHLGGITMIWLRCVFLVEDPC